MYPLQLEPFLLRISIFKDFYPIENPSLLSLTLWNFQQFFTYSVEIPLFFVFTPMEFRVADLFYVSTLWNFYLTYVVLTLKQLCFDVNNVVTTLKQSREKRGEKHYMEVKLIS